MYDLYNNLKVYEAEIKGQSRSSSNSYNVDFVSSKNTSSINETVNAAPDIPAVGSKEQPFTSSYVDDIDTNDLEEMDLKWQVAMITMRVKKFMKKTGRNLNFNGKEPVGFDKTRVECYNFHIRGHFARECRAPRNQGNRSGDNERRVVPVETHASSLVVQDGLGRYDWSYQAEEGPTDFALMAHSSDSANSSNSEGNRSGDNERRVVPVETHASALVVQDGLESLEDRIRAHQKNEIVFEESISFLKYDVQVRDISIKDLKYQLEEAIKEKDDLKENLTKFEESSKNLTKLINSQMSENDKTGLGYDSQLSENEMPKCEIFKAASDSSVIEIDEDNNQSKDRKRQDSRVDWNGMKTQKQGIGFEFNKRSCFVCGIVNHLIKDCTFYENKMVYVVKNKGKGTGQREVRPLWNNARRVNHQNFSKMTHPHPKKNFVPTTIATKLGQVLVNAAKQNLAASTSTVRPKGKNVTTAGPKAVVNATERKKENAVKSSSCWIWRPNGKLIDHTSKDSGSYTLKRFNYIDPNGRLKIQGFLIVDAPGIYLQNHLIKLCFVYVGFQTTPQMVINSPCLTDKKELASPGQTFWATAKVKKVNDQEQIQALVNKKKVIITEDDIRSDLHFDDAEETACLLNEAVFEGLARMGY
nr:hypothetical protein [Tanacetum cinerariifolium]